jgi:hypothetical protein
MRKRPILTVGDLEKFIKGMNPKATIFLAPSILNLDEPKETQEFIDSDRKIKCVAIETIAFNNPKDVKSITLGWAEK